MSGPSAASFNHHEVMSRYPLGPSSKGPFAGVLLRAPDGGSFLLGSSFYREGADSSQLEATSSGDTMMAAVCRCYQFFTFTCCF